MRRIATGIILVLIGIMFGGCQSGTATKSGTAAPPDNGLVFRAEKYGEVTIRGAKDGLPNKATVFVCEVPCDDPAFKYKYMLGVQPVGLPVAWIGSVAGDDNDFDNLANGHNGMHPNLAEVPDDPDPRGLRWLSANPPLLHILAWSCYPGGNGAYVARYDVLVLFEKGKAKVLLNDKITLNNSGGGGNGYEAERTLKSRVTDEGVEITCTDHSRETTSDWFDGSRPLCRQYDGEMEGDAGKILKVYRGCIELERTRTWLFLGKEHYLREQSNVATYLVQEEDSWEDITSGLLRDPGKAADIRKANPEYKNLSAPPVGKWIVVPDMPWPE